MTTSLRLLTAAALLSCTLACGGADVTGDDQGFQADDVKVDLNEPTTWTAVAGAVSGHYAPAKTPNIIVIQGNIGPTDGFNWSYTFVSDDGLDFVTVQCDGKATKVIAHHHQAARQMGQALLDLKKVKVSFSKVMKLATADGLRGRLTQVTLSEALTADMHPHWFVDMGGKELAVDANNGEVLK